MLSWWLFKLISLISPSSLYSSRLIAWLFIFVTCWRVSWVWARRLLMMNWLWWMVISLGLFTLTTYFKVSSLDLQAWNSLGGTMTFSSLSLASYLIFLLTRKSAGLTLVTMGAIEVPCLGKSMFRKVPFSETIILTLNTLKINIFII